MSQSFPQITAQPAIAVTSLGLRDENNAVSQSLKEKGYHLRTHPLMTPASREELRELLADSVGLIAGMELLTREVMEAAPHLRVISRNGVGYDAVDLQAATELGIVVTYVPDAMVDAVADLTLGLLLSSARRIAELAAEVKQGRWPREMAHDVGGQTLGIIGTGRIGTAVARRAKAFGMRLVGCDPYTNPLFVEELGGSYLPLEELLAVSDFVALHSPATAETKGLMNAERFGQMKRGAILINTARGVLVDEQALLDALDSGHLAGAALDVLSTEPPKPGTPAETVSRHPKVVSIPHVASYTPNTIARMSHGAMVNLLDVLEGRRPQSLANPEVYERGLRVKGEMERG